MSKALLIAGFFLCSLSVSSHSVASDQITLISGVQSIECSDTDITLVTQAQIDGFEDTYGVCNTVAGNLYIFDDTANIIDFDGLSSLKKIGGKLFIRFRGTPQVVDFAGFDFLEEAGGIRVSSNSPSSHVVSNTLEIAEFNSLIHIGSDGITITNMIVPLISGFANLTTVEGSIVIDAQWDSRVQTRWAGFDRLISAGGLTLSGNPVSIEMMPQLKYVTGNITLDKLGTSFALPFLENVQGDMEYVGLGSGSASSVGQDRKLTFSRLATIDGNVICNAGCFNLADENGLIDITGSLNINKSESGAKFFEKVATLESFSVTENKSYQHYINNHLQQLSYISIMNGNNINLELPELLEIDRLHLSNITIETWNTTKLSKVNEYIQMNQARLVNTEQTKLPALHTAPRIVHIDSDFVFSGLQAIDVNADNTSGLESNPGLKVKHPDFPKIFPLLKSIIGDLKVYNWGNSFFMLDRLDGNLVIENINNNSNCRGLASILGWPDFNNNILTGSVIFSGYHPENCSSIRSIYDSLIISKPSLQRTSYIDGKVKIEISPATYTGLTNRDVNNLIDGYEVSCSANSLSLEFTASNLAAELELPNGQIYSCQIHLGDNFNRDVVGSINFELDMLDSDGDGMVDAWEIRYGLDPNDPTDAASDTDNDGVTALDEYLAGTIPSGSLDIDGNGQYDALTDGLLLLRGMFGLTNDALINGAVASDAQYTSGEEIKERIDILGDLVDIDGNGQVDALTDGLVILRYLFGLRGDVLINGVIASNATITDANGIDSKIDSIKPAM